MTFIQSIDNQFITFYWFPLESYVLSFKLGKRKDIFYLSPEFETASKKINTI